MSSAAYPGPWYQAMKAERDALLERVAVLEQALENIDTTITLFGPDTSLEYIQGAARKGLNGGS